MMAAPAVDLNRRRMVALGSDSLIIAAPGISRAKSISGIAAPYEPRRQCSPTTPFSAGFVSAASGERTAAGIEVTPKDGVRRRLHALLDGRKLHLTLDNDRFVASQPIVLQEDLSELRFSLESDNPATHVVQLSVSGLPSGEYTVGDDSKPIAKLSVKDGIQSLFELPMEAGVRPKLVTLRKSNDSR